MKECGRCGQIKHDEAFAWKIQKRNIRQAMCRECKSAYNKNWYRQNSARHKAAAYASTITLRLRNREWFRQLKSELSCKECGETHPACLDLHHRDPGQKDIAVADAINKAWSLARIEAEVAKCDVLCANCHRKLHFQERDGMDC